MFNISKKKDSKRHLNKGTRLSTDIVKIGHYQSGQLKVPGSPPSAMPCFSFLRPGGCEAFEKVKESVKDSLKRCLNCASLLSRPSWISTCLPLEERSVPQAVDDTTQIPRDLHQSLRHIEGFGEDRSESASCHRPSTCRQTSQE